MNNVFAAMRFIWLPISMRKGHENGGEKVDMQSFPLTSIYEWIDGFIAINCVQMNVPLYLKFSSCFFLLLNGDWKKDLH